MIAHARLLVLWLLLFAATVSPAWADEVVRQFLSDVTVNTDGSLDVRETITVLAEGSEIRRGIQRDFPTTYTDRFGQRVRVGFEVVDVQRDGRAEKWETISQSNGVRIRIGDADVFLDHGEHTYAITYHTTRQIGFFESFDELYWNVTGNGWTFPIERAAVVIRLPSGAAIKQHAVFTGDFGETGTDARVSRATGNRFEAATSRRLNPGEGLTVAVGWQKGIVTPPSEAEKRWLWVMDNLGYFLLGLTVLGAGTYYLWAWSRVGRDPPGGTIVPLFHPPEGLGPAGVRYIWAQKFDNQAFAAAVVGLAVKKRLTIADVDGDYSLTTTSKSQDGLTRSEKALLSHLPSGELELKPANNAAVRIAREALSSSLDDEYDGHMFMRNRGWFAIGAIISSVGLLVSGFMLPSDDGAVAIFTTIFASIWWGVILVAGNGVLRGLFSPGSFFLRIKSLFGLIFLLPFVAAGIAVPVVTWFGSGASYIMFIFIAAAVGLVLFNALFYWLLKAPTPKGRALLDQIEGFRMYMTTAEEERLKVLHPPEKTPELFERYLPYAMALDCENEWNAKFAAVLAAAAAAGAATAATSPSWYNGGHWGSRDFSRDLNNGLTSSISSAAVAPGSSSGSSGGGGGFSGGGGGGGGGSGW